MDRNFREAIEKEFFWFPRLGWGHLNPQKDFEYDSKYIQKFVDYEKDDNTLILNKMRTEFVNKYIRDGWLLDYGCGAGTFIKIRGPNTFGFDVSSVVIEWLERKKLFFDPEETTYIDSISFWDSLEHIKFPGVILKKIRHYAFVSMPIYDNLDHVLSSKHFKPNEHLYYFTRDGLIRYMTLNGFNCIEESNFESLIGRKDIGSFVFKRQ